MPALLGSGQNLDYVNATYRNRASRPNFTSARKGASNAERRMVLRRGPWPIVRFPSVPPIQAPTPAMRGHQFAMAARRPPVSIDGATLRDELTNRAMGDARLLGKPVMDGWDSSEEQEEHEEQGYSKSSWIWRNWINGTVKKASPRDDIEILQNKKLKPARDAHGFTPQEAFKIVYENARELAKLARERGWKVRSISGEDLPFAVFNDMDRCMFSGVLKGNVCLQVTDELPPGIYGSTSAAGQEGPRISIGISRDIWNVPATPYQSEHLLRVLLHQMIHAFLLQTCGFKLVGTQGAGHNLGHRGFFSDIASVLDRCILNGWHDRPALIGHANLRRHIGSTDVRDRALWTRSNCAGTSICDGRDRGDDDFVCAKRIEEMKDTTSVPNINLEAKSPRDSYGVARPLSQFLHHYVDRQWNSVLRVKYAATSQPFVEFIYRERAVPIQISTLNHNPTLQTKKPGSSVSIAIPDDRAFEDFYEYLTRPDQAQVSAGVTGNVGRQYGSRTRPKPLYLVRLHRISTMISNPELRGLCMRGLFEPEPCGESDIIDAINYIYHGPEPLNEDDKKALTKLALEPSFELREWAKKWFVTAYNVGHRREVNVPVQNYNLDALQSQGGEWAIKWQLCREKGGCLIVDVDSARDTIEKCRRESVGDEIARRAGGRPHLDFLGNGF